MSLVKQSVRFLAALFVCVFLITTVSAVEEAKVYAEEIAFETGDDVRIPVLISNNTGIMGFRVTIEYPDILHSPDVTRGEKTTKGSFNTSITDKTDGSFDIVWNNSSDIKGDGVLFVLNFKVDEKAKKGEYYIKITHSQPDTFNENWDDVKFITSPIKIHLEENITVTENPKVETSENVEMETLTFDEYMSYISQNVDSDYIQTSIEAVMNNMNISSFENLEESEISQFILLLKKSFKAYGVDKECIITQPSADEFAETMNRVYKKSVSDSFQSSVEETTNSEDVVEIIDGALNDAGAESIDKVPEDKKESFTQTVIDKITKDKQDIKPLPDFLTTEEKFEIIEDLYGYAQKGYEGVTVSIPKIVTTETENTGQDGENKPNINTGIVVGITVSVVLIALLTSGVIYKKKGKK